MRPLKVWFAVLLVMVFVIVLVSGCTPSGNETEDIGNGSAENSENGVDLNEKSAPIMLVTTDDTPMAWVGQLIAITVE